MMLDELKKLGADVDGALHQYKKENMYEKLLKKFEPTAQGIDTKTPLQKKDGETAFIKAHSMKGVCSNLFLTPLYNAYTEICTLIKQNELDNALALLEKTLPLQEEFIKAIGE